MKYKKKYNVDLDEISRKNKLGLSLTDLSIEYNIPKTSLNRYLNNEGYTIYVNRKTSSQYQVKRIREREVYTCVNAWKKALIIYNGYKCMVCGYNKIVEAHHIILLVDGGQTSISNGILLCPNHHAEAHAGLLDYDLALIKSGELLERPEEDNQQPSSICNEDREGSTTRDRVKTVTSPRAPGSRSKRLFREEYINSNSTLRDMI